MKIKQLQAMLIALFYFFSQSLRLNIGYKNNYKKNT